MLLAGPPSALLQIPDGEAGIKLTLDLMTAYVRAFRKFPAIRTFAQQLAAQAGSKNWPGQINNIFTWVQSNIVYVQDIRDVETLQTPAQTLTIESGDCDDMCTLLCAMLESVGFRTRFMAIAMEPGQFEHVFVQAQMPNRSKWYSLDPTEPQPMGWQPPGFVDWIVKDN